MKEKIVNIESLNWWFIIKMNYNEFKEELENDDLQLYEILQDLIKIRNEKYYKEIKDKWFTEEKKEIKLIKEDKETWYFWIPKANFYYLGVILLSLYAEKKWIKYNVIFESSKEISMFEKNENLILEDYKMKVLDTFSNGKQITYTVDFFFKRKENYNYNYYTKEQIEKALSKHFPFLTKEVFSWFAISPARSGKTITMVEQARLSGERTLIMVDTSAIFKQFVDNIPKFFDINPETELMAYKWIRSFSANKQQINTKIWIAMVDTLYSAIKNEQPPKRLEIIKKELSKYNTIIIDEAHSSASMKYIKVMEALKYNKIFWYTATKMRKDWLINVLDRYIGAENIATVHQKEVWSRVLDIKIYPFIIKHDKDFWFVTKLYGKDTLNFSKGTKKLYNDNHRNSIILKKVIDAVNKDRMIILINGSVEAMDRMTRQINDLYDKGGEPIAYTINAKTPLKKRHEILEKFEDAGEKRARGEDFRPKVLSATYQLLWKWFDWPYFDTMFLIRPLSSNFDQTGWRSDSRWNIIQCVNRIWNNTKWKKEPICLDIVDITPIENVLENMALWRYYKLYKKWKELWHNFIPMSENVWSSIKD